MSTQRNSAFKKYHDNIIKIRINYHFLRKKAFNHSFLNDSFKKTQNLILVF